MSRIPFHSLSFMDFFVYEVTTLIFDKSESVCHFSKNVAIPFLLVKRATIAPNKLIELEKISKFRKQNEDTPVNVHGYERASSNPSRRLDSHPLMINKQGNK